MVGGKMEETLQELSRCSEKEEGRQKLSTNQVGGDSMHIRNAQCQRKKYLQKVAGKRCEIEGKTQATNIRKEKTSR